MATKPGPNRAREICLEVEDHSTVRKSAVSFFLAKGFDPRTAPAQAARLAEQFVALNATIAPLLDIRIDRDFDGSNVWLDIRAGNAVGAVPLISPSTARYDYGVIVRPRFSWAGIGPMLSEMGWRVAPSLLKLPLLRRSERQIPRWVLSSLIFVRLAALLQTLSRRFELVSEERASPRGRINWDDYAQRSLPNAKFLYLPCTFPDLQEDRKIKGAIRYITELHLRALQPQSEIGNCIQRLIEFGQQILFQVQSFPIYVPTTQVLQSWMRRPMPAGHFLEGLQAIEWTVEGRGLAGDSDLQGLPWRLAMDEFFEAWVETIFSAVARATGAQMRTGRQSQTTRPINWQPSFIGSQRSLKPDVWLEWDNTTMIVDAKYKRHWEELHEQSWAQVEEELRNRHRNDLFQVLAYANLASTKTVIACLAYPCSFQTWEELQAGGRLINKAEISSGFRIVHLWLIAVPMSADSGPVANQISEAVRGILTA